VRLDDLDVICAVLECSPADLLLPEPSAPATPSSAAVEQPASGAQIRPVRRGGSRTAPPV
jgi:hypothetical protein